MSRLEFFFNRWVEASLSGAQSKVADDYFDMACSPRRRLSRFEDDYYRHWPFEVSPAEEAAEGYLKWLTPIQELAVFLSIRGMCLQEAGRLEEAAEAFAAAARLAPGCRGYAQAQSDPGSETDASRKRKLTEIGMRPSRTDYFLDSGGRFLHAQAQGRMTRAEFWTLNLVGGACALLIACDVMLAQANSYFNDTVVARQRQFNQAQQMQTTTRNLVMRLSQAAQSDAALRELLDKHGVPVNPAPSASATAPAVPAAPPAAKSGTNEPVKPGP